MSDRRAHRLSAWLIAGVIAAGGAAAVAVPAMAAQPKNNSCWNTCGGDGGPVDGVFFVADHHVQQFGIEEKCLGTDKIPQPIGPPFIAGADLSITKNLAISRAGTFSYTGKAAVYAGGKKSKVKVKLSGKFLTSTKAKVSVQIFHGTCGTKHIIFHADG